MRAKGTSKSLYETAFTRWIFLMDGEDATPPKGKRWLIIQGRLNHITGSLSSLTTEDLQDIEVLGIVCMLNPGAATIATPIFNTTGYDADHKFSQKPFLVTDDEKVKFAGAATAWIRFRVLEF